MLLAATLLITSLWNACRVLGQGIQTYKVVDTKQTKCYNSLTKITCPSTGTAFHGQDAHYTRNAPSYHDNGDGTVTDLVTGLMWQKSPDRNGDGAINANDKLYYEDAVAAAASLTLGNYNDWRLPAIKELYSLILFSGFEPSPSATSSAGLIPFIDTGYFPFGYGDLSAGERIIDAQYISATKYISTTLPGDEPAFGVNFADGRIKGYPTAGEHEQKYYVKYVRGNTEYGKNNFEENADGTILDLATGLMWMKNDNGQAVSWQNALSYAEGFSFAGYSDWRLPNAKELESIVDYTRSPSTNNSAAINALFESTAIINEGQQADYAYYWSSTTHFSQSTNGGKNAAYLCFGRCLGYMYSAWNDVHGAGAQRSDPKTGSASQYPYGHGPQGDAIRVNNFVRLVRA